MKKIMIFAAAAVVAGVMMVGGTVTQEVREARERLKMLLKFKYYSKNG